jgi:diguanylate cyclase (GGDEF)-like protein
MFFNKKKGTAEPAAPTAGAAARSGPAASADPSDRDFDQALDSLASFLRHYGRWAFDVPSQDAEKTREQCEKWARHLLIKAPRPGDEEAIEKAAAEGAPRAPVRRDWSGPLQFFAGHRKVESAHVSRSFDDMREAIWAFIHNLNAVLKQDVGTDDQLQQNMERLQEVATRGTAEELRREALATTDAIGNLLHVRKESQAQQASELRERVTVLGTQLEQARRESELDPLTQLANRGVFDRQLARALDLVQILDRPTCLLFLDIDRFKTINDTYGHPFGDEVLKKLSDCLVRSFRRRDDTLARYGGEEFAVIFRDTSLSDARQLALRLIDTVRGITFPEKLDPQGEPVRFTISCGLAPAQKQDTAALWLERADQALYEAKHLGRDRLVEAPAPNRPPSSNALPVEPLVSAPVKPPNS